MKFFMWMMLMVAVPAFGQAQTASNVVKKVSAKDVRQIMDTTQGPLIVNFWASWCSPCTKEIPWFDSIIAANSAPVKLLLVSLDFASAYPKQVTDFVKKRGYKGEVVYLNESNADYFIPIIEKKWSGAIPASIFINNNKKYYQFLEQQLPEKRFELELRKLLE